MSQVFSTLSAMYSDQGYISLKIVYSKAKKRARQLSPIPVEYLRKLYQSQIGANVLKKKNLQKFCNRLLILIQLHDFYNNLTVLGPVTLMNETSSTIDTPTSLKSPNSIRKNK